MLHQLLAQRVAVEPQPFGSAGLVVLGVLHHHFEQLGVKESQVVIRFWIVSMMLCLAGLASLKLR